MSEQAHPRQRNTLAVLLPGSRRSLSRPNLRFASITAASKKSKASNGAEIDESRKVALKPVSDVLAGALARAGSQSTIHPLDTLKVRLQTSSSSAAKGISKIGQLVPPATRSAKVSNLVCQVKSLYRGVAGAATGAGIALGAYFACYGVATNLLVKHTELPAPSVAFFSGGLAAAGSGVVKVPLAVCIRSVQANLYPNVFEAASSITQAAGVRGLFTGFTPNLLEDVPDMAFKFAAYESLRQLHTSMSGRTPNPGEDFAIGAFSGAFAAAATTPLDVIKTNMMCNASTRPSMVSAAQAVYSDGGAKAFLRGIGPRALSNGINSAVFFCFFEALRGQFARQAAVKEARAEQRAREMASAPAVSMAAIDTGDFASESLDGGYKLQPVGASVSLSTSRYQTRSNSSAPSSSGSA